MFDFVEEFCKIIIVHRNFVKINYWGKKITRQPQQTTKKLAEKVANLLGDHGLGQPVLFKENQ